MTRKIVLTPNLLEYMCRLNKETGEFVKKITKFYFDFHWEWEHIIGCVINDPLAVAYFINPNSVKALIPMYRLKQRDFSWTVCCGFYEFLPESIKCKGAD